MQMLDEIFENLKAEILADEAQANVFSDTLLRSKVERAYREIKTARNYPITYSEARIESDMENYYSQITDLAEYDYAHVGSEGMDSYSSDGVSIKYHNRNDIFNGVRPISR